MHTALRVDFVYFCPITKYIYFFMLAAEILQKQRTNIPGLFFFPVTGEIDVDSLDFHMMKSHLNIIAYIFNLHWRS